MKKSKSFTALPRAIPHALAAFSAGILAAAAIPAGASPAHFLASPVNAGKATLTGTSFDAGLAAYGLDVEDLAAATSLMGLRAPIDAVSAGTLVPAGASAPWVSSGQAGLRGLSPRAARIPFQNATLVKRLEVRPEVRLETRSQVQPQARLSAER